MNTRRFALFSCPKSASNLLGQILKERANFIFLTGLFIQQPDYLKKHFNLHHKLDFQTGLFSSILQELIQTDQGAKAFTSYRNLNLEKFMRAAMSSPDPRVGLKFEPFFNGYANERHLIDPRK